MPNMKNFIERQNYFNNAKFNANKEKEYSIKLGIADQSEIVVNVMAYNMTTAIRKSFMLYPEAVCLGCSKIV